MRSQLRLYTQDINELFSSYDLQIKETIEEVNENYILNVGEEQYAQALETKYQIDFPILNEDGVYIDSFEEEIPATSFPPGFHVQPNKTYRKVVIVYHIPYTGNINFLRFRPSQYALQTPVVSVDQFHSYIFIEIINFRDDKNEIEKIFQDSLRAMKCNYESLKTNCDDFNANLNARIIAMIKTRKANILKKRQFLSSLGIPLKKRDDTPSTFSVPQPKLREKIVIMPQVHVDGYQPEPTLSQESYRDILKLINDVGKNFERMPSVYRGKAEEDLRDHILLTLDPNFQLGSASGETFNKSGKTDILLRYDSSVVFVAECKIWRGEKEFIRGIDQLLGYLTWRDSKVAYVVFVPNKNITSIIEQLKTIVPKHPNFVRSIGEVTDSWFNYVLNLPIDRNKEIKMGVLIFHIPTA